MARNRKNQSAALRFGLVLKTILLCVLVGGSGIGFVWQKSQIEELGKQMLKREKKLSAMKDQNEKLKNQLASMHSPPNLDARIRELSLGLTEAQPSQILRLAEPWPQAIPERERHYAAMGALAPVQ